MTIGIDLKEIVNGAWKETQAVVGPNDLIGENKRGTVHRKWSEKWVDCLAGRFQSQYPGDAGYRVFWKRNESNKTQFYRNEFLFDVMVGRVATRPSLSPRPETNLHYIAECEWAVESELNNRNTRQMVVDMSKLVMADAKNKLFVAAYRKNAQDKILEILGEIGDCCSNNTFVCFVAHPESWIEKPRDPCLYERRDGKWCQLVAM